MINLTPNLDRQYILSQVNEEEIFERYGAKIVRGIFRSPLRIDRHPTCRFFRRRDGRLSLHDFSGDFSGDCFDFVQRVLRCNYDTALRHVGTTFGIKVSGGSGTRTPIKPEVIINIAEECKLRVSTMPWDEEHLEWWERYGVDISTLEKFKVFPVRQVWMNDRIYFNRDFATGNEIVFVYKFGGHDYKVYFPTRKYKRFLHNNPDILQGFGQLPEKGNVVCITKSMKDVICLSLFDIPAVAPMSENSVISDDVLEYLREQFTNVYALYDRDKTGMRSLVKLRQKGVDVLMMPEATRCKDFADYCKLDLSSARNLVNTFKELRNL